MSDKVRITTLENGPLQVEGSVDLAGHDGHAVNVPGAKIYLCRCGASSRKPFCDGTHSKVGFDGTLKT